MQVKVMIGNNYRYVEGEQSPIPELAITESLKGEGYTLTHIASGRCVTLKPLTLPEVATVIRALELAKIPWKTIPVGNPESKDVFLSRLSAKEAQLMGLVA